MDVDKRSVTEYQSAADYLKHFYEISDALPELPLADEPFISTWTRSASGVEPRGREALDFLVDGLGLPIDDFRWNNVDALQLGFIQTLAGRLPLITTASHTDFRSMEALVNGRGEALALPATVNAFTIQARAMQIRRHRLILLNRAPYSNIPANALGFAEDEWLARSQRLRLRHECAHYETLRLFGGMANHALDEIAADALGQLAAFGNFDADRQRLFFGLERGRGVCHGRLSFYCQTVCPEERETVYRSVDRLLDDTAAELGRLIRLGATELELLKFLVGTSILERLD